MRGAWLRRSKAAASLAANRLGECDSRATTCRWCGSAHQLQVWFEQAGSLPSAQLFQNFLGRPETTCFCGFPGRRERFVQGMPFFVGEVITLIVGNQIDDRPLG